MLVISKAQLTALAKNGSSIAKCPDAKVDKLTTASFVTDAVDMTKEIAKGVLKVLPRLRQLSAFSRAIGVSKYSLNNAKNLMERAAPWLTGLSVAITAVQKIDDNAKAFVNGTTRERLAAGTKVVFASFVSYGVGKLAGFVGMKAGALIGAKLGAAVGSVVPGAGTIVGAIIGVAVGVAVGYVAGKVAEKLIEKPADKLIDRMFSTGAKQQTRGP